MACRRASSEDQSDYWCLGGRPFLRVSIGRTDVDYRHAWRPRTDLKFRLTGPQALAQGAQGGQKPVAFYIGMCCDLQDQERLQFADSILPLQDKKTVCYRSEHI